MTISKNDDMPATTIPSRKPLLGAALMGVTLLWIATTMNYSSPTTTSSSHSTEATAAASWSETLGLQDLVDYYYYQNRRRRLHHPHGEIKKYLMCTRLMAKSDGNFDNSLDLAEFQDFSNQYADESMGVTLGATSLPEPLQTVFQEYAEKTDGRNNKIIDIYGSRNGERDGITTRQEELLENLCNETSVILDGLFSEEAKMLGKSVMAESTMKEISHTEAPTPAPTVAKDHSGPQNVLVNTSFTMTIPDDMTADDLQHTLDTGEDPGGLKDAFSHFVEDVVHDLNSTTDANGNGIADVDEMPAADGGVADLHGRRDMEGSVRGSSHALVPFARRLNIGFDNSSAEIYKFVESACPAATSAGNEKKGGLNQALNKTSSSEAEEEEEEEKTTLLGSNETSLEDAEEEDEEESDLLAELEAGEEEEAEVRTKKEMKKEKKRKKKEAKKAKKAEENEDGRALQARPIGAVGGSAPQADPNADGQLTEEEYVDATEGLSRKELRCVTAMGKFRIQVDEEDEDNEGGLDKIYEKAMTATKKAVDDGVLEKRLEETPQDNIFHIEGHGVVEDDAFDPYVEVEDNKGLRTVDIILISVGSVLIFCLCCVLCFVELERKTRPRPGL